MIRRYACSEFLRGVDAGASGEIPDLSRPATSLPVVPAGDLVAVPGLHPGCRFFGHLALRRFPVSDLGGAAGQKMDYLVSRISSTIFRSTSPCFSTRSSPNTLRPTAPGARCRARGQVCLHLARLYWYMVRIPASSTRGGVEGLWRGRYFRRAARYRPFGGEPATPIASGSTCSGSYAPITGSTTSRRPISCCPIFAALFPRHGRVFCALSASPTFRYRSRRRTLPARPASIGARILRGRPPVSVHAARVPGNPAEDRRWIGEQNMPCRWSRLGPQLKHSGEALRTASPLGHGNWAGQEQSPDTGTR